MATQPNGNPTRRLTEPWRQCPRKPMNALMPTTARLIANAGAGATRNA